jgi:hypothetical protein
MTKRGAQKPTRDKQEKEHETKNVKLKIRSEGKGIQ